MPTYNTKNQYYSVPSCNPPGGPTYDLNGNPTNDCSHSYAYDSGNNPVTIDGTSNFIYDALGRMVEYSGGAGTEVLYGPTGGKLALMNGQTLQRAMVPLPGGGTAIFKNASPALSHYRHADWLGSARLSTTPAQTLYYDVAYGPYGETYAPLIGSGGSASVAFTGVGKDSPTDLYPFMFRQYNSAQSRWVWPDPAGLGAVSMENPQTFNRYAYVGNAPLNAVDPLGLLRSDVYGSGGMCGVEPDCTSWLGNPFDAITDASSSAFILDFGAAWQSYQTQQFQQQGGLGSPVQQGFQQYLGSVFGNNNVRHGSSGLETFIDTSPPCKVTSSSVTCTMSFPPPGFWVKAGGDVPMGEWGEAIFHGPGMDRLWNSAASWTDPRTIAAWYGASALVGGGGYVISDIASGPAESVLFGRGYFGWTGYLNGNAPWGDLLRIGYGWNGTQSVFRIAGSALGYFMSNPHIDLWPPSAW